MYMHDVEDWYPDDYISLEDVVSARSAVNYGKGKPAISLIPGDVLAEVARVMTRAAEIGKYDDFNWRRGLPWREVYDKAQRHQLAWLEREDIDPETQRNHIAHALCDLIFLMHYILNHEQYKHLDNRYKPGV